MYLLPAPCQECQHFTPLVTWNSHRSTTIPPPKPTFVALLLSPLLVHNNCYLQDMRLANSYEEHIIYYSTLAASRGAQHSEQPGTHLGWGTAVVWVGAPSAAVKLALLKAVCRL